LRAAAARPAPAASFNNACFTVMSARSKCLRLRLGSRPLELGPDGVRVHIPAGNRPGAGAIDILYILCWFAIPAAIGAFLPTRIAAPLLLGVAAAFALSWFWLGDGRHNDPWPFLLAPVLVGLLFGIVLRWSVGAVRRARRARSG
jgi:hypothetical protein